MKLDIKLYFLLYLSDTKCLFTVDGFHLFIYLFIYLSKKEERGVFSVPLCKHKVLLCVLVHRGDKRKK